MFEAVSSPVKVSIGHVAFSSIQTQRIPLGLNEVLFRSIENPGCIYPFAKDRGVSFVFFQYCKMFTISVDR